MPLSGKMSSRTALLCSLSSFLIDPSSSLNAISCFIFN